jgi:hypothetical protein
MFTVEISTVDQSIDQSVIGVRTGSLCVRTGLSPVCPDIPADTLGREVWVFWVSGHPTNMSGHV